MLQFFSAWYVVALESKKKMPGLSLESLYISLAANTVYIVTTVDAVRIGLTKLVGNIGGTKYNWSGRPLKMGDQVAISWLLS